MRTKRSATLLGILAILFWSSTVGVARSLSGPLGALNQGALTCLLGGGVMLGLLLLRRGALKRMFAAPQRYLLVCGTMVASYLACIYGAVHLARTDSAVLTVGMINYLWPALIFVFAVPVLKARAKWTLAPGVLLAASGVFLTELSIAGGASPLAGLADNWGAYLLALAGAVLWALYSNYARKLGGGEEGNAMGLFILGGGLLLSLLCLIFPEPVAFTPRAWLELIYMAVFVTVLSYSFWDLAMRQGNFLLVSAVSYLVPVLSALVSVWYLAIHPSWLLWPGCLLAVTGALVCKRSVAV